LFALWNAANRLFKRDRLDTNAETLAKSSNDPRVLRQLANAELGKGPSITATRACQRDWG
jgi:hypothetical protein